MPISRRIVLVFSAAVAALSSQAAADVVRLPNGGEVRGQLADQRKPGSPVEIATLLGGRIIIETSQAVSVSRRPALVEEYVTRSREIPDTIEAHWELAEWCRSSGLLKQREEQLEGVVALDPEHVPARRALGHIRHRGDWMSRDEAMRAQGYIKHKGKYVTQQELDLLNKTDAQREAEKVWYPKVRTWFAWATGQNAGRRVEGLESLRAIDTADAIPALDQFLGENREAGWRLFFVDRLRTISGERPVPILVLVSLGDPEPKVRIAAFSAIDVEQRDTAIPYFVEALENDVNDVVQRAAEALGMIGDTRAVPHLIRALITRHKVDVQVPVQENVAISSVRGSGQYAIGAAPAVLPPNIEGLLRTGQLPYGVQIIDPNIRYTTVTVRVDVRNESVLAALKTLTNNDFGYDQDAWQVFWAARQSGVGRL